MELVVHNLEVELVAQASDDLVVVVPHSLVVAAVEQLQLLLVLSFDQILRMDYVDRDVVFRFSVYQSSVAVLRQVQPLN